ncbi:lipoyl(octanoyl) transferase LipB [Conexibacter sp. DBS9H8]|uniref:lipoyl(octanoyl) transferase LipB n=1 Tax=Conexibacter sp. DBS9H8 TaxID=2937801 RepID=UPI002010244E|nr:lipoyl(octanoyl) transferase LipB [Conexibacter sp. DBS9H8]
MDELWVAQLGLIDYRTALARQEQLRDARRAGAIPDTMLVLEHPPVITRGRRSSADELPLGEAFFHARGIDVVDVNRGGRLTYHGPGQLVGYPIVAVDDVVGHVRRLERALVRALAETGITARARPEDGPDFTGVWVGEAKIASIGVHVAGRVTTHGFALNVANDMTPWTWFTPCGLATVAMTSVAEQLGEDAGCGEPLLRCLRQRIAHAVAETLGLRQRQVTPERLDRALKSSPGIGAEATGATVPTR